MLQSKRILEGDEGSRRLTDVLPFGPSFVGRRRKKLEDCGCLVGGVEGLGCLELVVQEEMVQTPDEVE